MYWFIYLFSSVPILFDMFGNGGAGRVAARPRCTYCTEIGYGKMRGVQWLLFDVYSLNT